MAAPRVGGAGDPRWTTGGDDRRAPGPVPTRNRQARSPLPRRTAGDRGRAEWRPWRDHRRQRGLAAGRREGEGGGAPRCAGAVAGRDRGRQGTVFPGGPRDRESVVEGKRVDLGGCRII